MQKQPIDREQLRRTPAQFSWLDHRLVRGNYLGRASAPAWGLYLVLVTVGDADGLSYYATRTLARLRGEARNPSCGSSQSRLGCGCLEGMTSTVSPLASL